MSGIAVAFMVTYCVRLRSYESNSSSMQCKICVCLKLEENVYD